MLRSLRAKLGRLTRSEATLRRTDPRHVLGARGERAARRYLTKHGHRILARDAQVAGVQLDLICLETATRALVVVEVKSRMSSRRAHTAYGHERALRSDQLRRLHTAAATLATRNGWTHGPIRVDLVLVEFGDAKQPRITHHQGRPRR